MHILVAEDNRVNQKLIQRLISRIPGATCTIVGDGQQALNYLSSPPSACPRPNIILMDISMPVLSGLGATSTIRTQPPFATDPVIASTPIVALTASRMWGESERLAAKGFDDYLTKPIRRDSLTKLVYFWASRRVVPRQGGLAVPPTGNVAVMPPAMQWGPMPLRAFRGPRSLL
ncbi:CheY-like superfamily [Aspergillus karnatakaensis]|uniref:response regulator n=1 Tax=Aspergillus karnatakaensis TaxID=1810916 RepID=UPI003CCDC3F3